MGLPLLCQKHKSILYVTSHLTNFVSKWTHHEEMFVEVQWKPLRRYCGEIQITVRNSIMLYGKERVKFFLSKGVKQIIPHYLPYRYFDL